MPALLISFGAQPLPLSLEASGYYDTDGNWVEDYSYYDPSYDPSYSTGGYYDELGNWISDGSGYGDTGSTGSSYDIWLSPSSEIDTDNDGISDYDEVYGYSIETESYYEVPYSYEEYNSETGEYVWRDSSYTSTTYDSIWVTTDPTDPDTDGDGLPDGWERLFSFHPNDPSDGYEDDDGDGLRNGLEYILGTDLWNPDTDEDGLTDGEEVLLFGTDPLNRHDPGTAPPTNGSETGGTGTGTGGTGTGTETGGTDSGGTSTGGNGLTPDWLTWQGEHFADLLAVDPDDPEAAGDGDPDNDELTNIEEFLLGTDPRNPDTDGDDLLDGWEVAGLVLHFDRSETPPPTAAPLPGETGFSGFVYGPYQFQYSFSLYDDDALTEIGVVETWMRTVETHDETWGITATTQETMERTGLYNAEGTLVFPDDGWIVNESGGLVPNTPVTTGPPEPTWTQYFNDEMQMWVGTLTNGSTVSTWWWVHTDPLDDDSDGDDMPDGWEYENWLNPKKASDAAEDPDDDTLPNLLEYLNGTDPWLSDTDGDELSDSHELNVTLTDPLDPADPGEDSGGTTPIGGVITTVTRYQAFGSSGGSSGGGGGSGRSGGGGSVLTMSGGGLLLGSQQSGLGNRLQPGNGGQKQTSQPVSEDELYFEVRRVFHRYDPHYESEGGGPGPDPGGAHDGHWEEMTDPVTDEVTLVWVSTGGATTNVEPSEPEPEPDPSETPKYTSISGVTIGGRYQSEVSEEYSSLPAVIGNIQRKTIPSETDWGSYFMPISSGVGAGFTTGQYPQGNRTASRGGGEHLEVRLARKTAPDGTHLAVERDVEMTFLKVFKHRPAPFDKADKWTIDKVEVVKIKIKKEDSTSVKDKENPVPDAVLKPEIVEGKITGVELVPVEVREAWSDQIKDVEANGMPNKTGRTEMPYIFMGARADGKGHGKLRIGSTLPEDIRDKVLWRFAKKGTENPEQGSSSYEEQGKVVRMTLDTPPNEDEKDFVVVFGYDENGDDNLTQSEVLGTPKTGHIQSGNSTTIPYTFKIVGQGRYDESRNYLLEKADSSTISSAFPNGSNLLRAFSNGVAATGSTSESVFIERLEPGLTHPVGIRFSPTAEPGESIKNIFPTNSDIASAILRATKIRNPLKDSLRDPKVIKKFSEWFFENPELPPTVGNIKNVLDDDVTFTWDWEELVGETSVNFLPTFTNMEGFSDVDLDCFLALGKAEVSGIVYVTANMIDGITEVRFSGSVSDLYDFWHDNKVAVFDMFVSPRRAAEVQSGFPSLGQGGRVTRTDVKFTDSDFDIQLRWNGL